MIQDIISFLQNNLKIVPELIVFFIASLPISELRGAIPVAIFAYKFSPVKAYIISVGGNIVFVVPFLFFLNYITDILIKRVPVLKKFFTWWFEKTRSKSLVVMKYKAIGLMLFVAVPLPVTGAWTGCVAAYLFGIRFIYAFLSILAGVMIAGVIVTLASIGILSFF